MSPSFDPNLPTPPENMTYLGQVLNRNVPLTMGCKLNQAIVKLSPRLAALSKASGYAPAIGNAAAVYRGLLKYAFTNPDLSTRAFSRAKLDFSNVMIPFMSTGCCSVYDVIDTHPKGSGGITYPKPKREFLDHPEAPARAADLLCLIQDDTPTFASGSLKNEVRLATKAARQFLAMEFNFWLADTTMNNNLEHNMELVPHFAMGSTPFLGGWDAMLRPLLDFPLFFGSDVGAMDSRMHKLFMQYDHSLIEACHHSTCTDCADLFRFVHDNTIETDIVLPNGHTYRKHQGHNSGGRCTCGRNSRYMLFLMLYGYYQSGFTEPFFSHFRVKIFGDDIIGSTDLSVEELNKVYDGVRTAGHEITVEMSFDICEIPFLSFKSCIIDGHLYPVIADPGRFAAHVVHDDGDKDSPLLQAKLDGMRMLAYFTPELYDELTRLMHNLNLPVRADMLVRRQWFPLEESRLSEDAVRYDPYKMSLTISNVKNNKPKRARRRAPKTSQWVVKPAVPANRGATTVCASSGQSQSSSSSSSSSKRDDEKRWALQMPSWKDNLAYQFAAQCLNPSITTPSTLPLRMERYHFYAPSSTIEGKKDANNEFFIDGSHDWIHGLAITRGAAETVTLAGSGTANVLSCAGNPFLAANQRDLSAPLQAAGSLAIYPSNFPGYRGYRLVGKGTAANVFSIKVATFGILSHEVLISFELRNLATGQPVWLSIGNNLTASGSSTYAVNAALTNAVDYSLRISLSSTRHVNVPFELEFYGVGDIGFPNHMSFCSVIPVPDIPDRSDTGIVAFQSLWFENTSSSLKNGGEVVGYRSPSDWSPPSDVPLFTALSNANCNFHAGPAKKGCYGWSLLPEAEDYKFRPIGARVLDKPHLIITGKLEDESTYQLHVSRGVYHWGASRAYTIFAPSNSTQLDLVRHALSVEPAFMENDTHLDTIKKILRKIKGIVTSPAVQTGAAMLASLL